MIANVYRTWDPCWAEIHIFYTDAIADADANAADVTQTVYNELLELAVEFVTVMDVGYSDCAVRVTSSCRLRCDVMRRRRDFIIIATIPNSIDVSGVGLCDDFVFAKRLQLNDRPVRMTLVCKNVITNIRTLTLTLTLIHPACKWMQSATLRRHSRLSSDASSPLWGF